MIDCLTVCWSVCLTACISICPSVRLSVCLSDGAPKPHLFEFNYILFRFKSMSFTYLCSIRELNASKMRLIHVHLHVLCMYTCTYICTCTCSRCNVHVQCMYMYMFKYAQFREQNCVLFSDKIDINSDVRSASL